MQLLYLLHQIKLNCSIPPSSENLLPPIKKQTLSDYTCTVPYMYNKLAEIENLHVTFMILTTQAVAFKQYPS